MLEFMSGWHFWQPRPKIDLYVAPPMGQGVIACIKWALIVALLQ